MGVVGGLYLDVKVGDVVILMNVIYYDVSKN